MLGGGDLSPRFCGMSFRVFQVGHSHVRSHISVPLNNIPAFSETGMPLELFSFCLCWQDKCYFCSGRDYSSFELDFVWEMDFRW